jgi:hypothetical protein
MRRWSLGVATALKCQSRDNTVAVVDYYELQILWALVLIAFSRRREYEIATYHYIFKDLMASTACTSDTV